MKAHRNTLVPILTLGATLIVSAAALTRRPPEVLDPADTKAAVTALTTRILESSQFAHQELDDELAGRFLDRYLDALDGGHMMFLESDLAEFARFRPSLAQDTRQTGDTRPAQIIFQRYLERLDQRAAHVADLLRHESFEFSGDERYRFDRQNAPRPCDLSAAQKLWRQQLRADYLQEKLAGAQDAEIVKTLTRRSERVVQTMRKFNEHTVLELYLNALAHVYDPHSDYLGHEQLQSFNAAMNLSLVGIGATLQTDDGYCTIRELVTGGPAARGGELKNGDRIVGVAQAGDREFTDLVDMPLAQAVDLIRGAKGSVVRLQVIPAGAASGAPHKTIAIVRDEISLEDQQAKARVVDLPGEDGNVQRVGVIDLPGFYASEGKGARSATADVARLLRKLKDEAVTGVILDLRRNGGGSLEEAIQLTGLFIPSGPVVQTRTPEGRVEVGADHDGGTLYDGPLVVLTSRLSASASEIVAGALQDYGRAVIVGDSSTFGKGTVQTIVSLGQVMGREGVKPSQDPGALKVTISKFYRPSGQSTQLAGVKSDIVLPSLTDSPEISEGELENPLPWDTIQAADYQPTGRVRPYLAALKARSQERIAQDAGFNEVQIEREQYRQIREDKSVSLNESVRRRERADLENRRAAQKEERLARARVLPPTYEVTLKNAATPGLGEPVKNVASSTAPDDSAPADDLVLREAQHILTDYSHLLSRSHPAAVTRR